MNASTIICMDKIRDLNNYPKMVAAVKSVEIYDNLKFINVSVDRSQAFLYLFDI